MKHRYPSKKVPYAKNGALIGAAAGVIWNLMNQGNNLKEGEKLDWKQLALQAIRGGAIGATVGFTWGAIKDYNNAQVKPTNTDKRLQKLVDSNRLTKDDKCYQLMNAKAEVIIGLLEAEFTGMINKPYRYGSTESGLALKGNPDIDICVEGLPGAFRSTAVMKDAVEDFLYSLVGDFGVKRIRRSRVSIAVYISIKGVERKIDITPKRLSANGSSAGYLSVEGDWLWGKSTRTKTDVRVLQRVKPKGKRGDIVMLLKIWRDKEQLRLPSLLLQLLVDRAYDAYRGEIPAKFTDKVILIFRYIADNIEGIVVRSPENTNNILTDCIDSSEKREIRNACRAVIEAYEYQPNSITDYLGC